MDQNKLSPCTRKFFGGQWKNKTSGDILVTSRRNSQALCEDLHLPSENCFKLDTFSVDESIDFLKKRIGLSSSCEDQEQGEKELAQELGGLPLALEQAASYIKELKCPILLYLQQYQSQKLMLLNTKTAKPEAEIYNEERLAVQSTWLLNFSYIENGQKDKELGKAATFFMKIAAYLHPDYIPIEILKVGAPEVEHKELRKRLEMPIGAEQIVDLLLGFSLFKRKSADTLSIHRLVQETLRDRCESEGETKEVLNSAIRMMHQTILNSVGGTDFFLRRDVLPNHMDKLAQMEFICDESKIEGRLGILAVNCRYVTNKKLKENNRELREEQIQLKEKQRELVRKIEEKMKRIGEMLRDLEGESDREDER